MRLLILGGTSSDYPFSRRRRREAIQNEVRYFMISKDFWRAAARTVQTVVFLGIGVQGTPTQADTPVPLYPLGMCSNGNIFTNPDYASRLLDSGAKICRTDVVFIDVRPKPGDDPNAWNWREMESVAKKHQEHPDLDFLVLLGYGAPWADDARFAAVKGAEIAGGQRGIDVMPAWSKGNLYGHYVYETVRRYKNVVHTWESWNEPDLPGHAFFKGAGRDFFAYQKACYLAAKQADPHCTVLFAGMCYANIEGYLFNHKLKPPTPYPPKECFFEDYLKACVQDPDAKKNHYYFDVMSQHSYSRATDLYDYAMVDRKLMHDYLGEEKPIWFTEMGFPDQGGLLGGSADDYCDYLLQSFAWGRRADVERFFHFQLDNSNTLGLYTGMLGDPKPALTTYRDVLAKEFAGARLVAQQHGNAGVGFLQGHSPFQPTWTTGYNLFAFQSGTRKLWMAFTDTDKAVDITIPAKRAQAILVDRHNHRTPITAHNGVYALKLPGAANRTGWPTLTDPVARALGEPEHLVGGATLVLIEE